MTALASEMIPFLTTAEQLYAGVCLDVQNTLTSLGRSIPASG